MTTIATDGVTIAADSLLTFGHERSLHPSKKILVRPGVAIYAVCGIGGMLEVLAEWVEAGADPQNIPKVDAGETWSLIEISKNGIRYFHSKALYPIPIQPPFAVGQGGEIATGAMDAGASPEQAVAIACRRSTTSGLPVHVENINEALGLVEPQREAAE